MIWKNLLIYISIFRTKFNNITDFISAIMLRPNSLFSIDPVTAELNIPIIRARTAFKSFFNWAPKIYVSWIQVVMGDPRVYVEKTSQDFLIVSFPESLLPICQNYIIWSPWKVLKKAIINKTITPKNHVKSQYRLDTFLKRIHYVSNELQNKKEPIGLVMNSQGFDLNGLGIAYCSFDNQHLDAFKLKPKDSLTLSNPTSSSTKK